MKSLNKLQKTIVLIYSTLFLITWLTFVYNLIFKGLTINIF